MLDDIKKTLWATADKLRANMDAAEYKHLVLGLIFVKYISDTFAARRAELTTRLTNPGDEYYFPEASTDDLVLRPSKSKAPHPPDIPVFLRAFLETLPIPSRDGAQTR